MGRKSRRNSAARRGQRISRLAATQHNLVSRTQLRGLGLSDDQIDGASRDGRLHRVFRGIYSVGVPLDRVPSRAVARARMRAATLACGDGAMVSHRTAAALFGFLDTAPVVVDVIAPGSRGRGIDGIRCHRVALPGPAETGTFEGIPCTSPARTLADIAAEVGMRTLRSAFERAAAKGMLDLDAVEAAAARPTRAARSLCADWRRAAPIARRGRLKSPLEAMVLPLVLAGGAPPPRVNAPVRLANGTTIEVDFLWKRERLVVEADSRDFHATDVAFERDRYRDRELLRIGYATSRITRLAAETETAEVVAAITAGLAEGARRR